MQRNLAASIFIYMLSSHGMPLRGALISGVNFYFRVRDDGSIFREIPSCGTDGGGGDTTREALINAAPPSLYVILYNSRKQSRERNIMNMSNKVIRDPCHIQLLQGVLKG
jgi:hypothetical protein